ncbi:hypothetical protein GNF10_20195 [Nostoc sp. UCD121]|nr:MULTISPECIES: hypothetical protein [unclassified Nostoc]MBC1224819.1 hypothetical protein [Nostoc sp. UCD120]MBC1278220.1 hypothetical protein [Nostoc sp. UCD121]MBC1298723.1 hypothetical protein [Nostoc sp. UCD122]
MTYALRNYGIDIAIVSYRPLDGDKLWIAMQCQAKKLEAIANVLTG